MFWPQLGWLAFVPPPYLEDMDIPCPLGGSSTSNDELDTTGGYRGSEIVLFSCPNELLEDSPLMFLLFFFLASTPLMILLTSLQDPRTLHPPQGLHTFSERLPNSFRNTPQGK